MLDSSQLMSLIEQLDEEEVILRQELKQLNKILSFESLKLKTQENKVYHGSVNLDKFVPKEFNQNPVLEKTELNNLMKEYNNTNNMFSNYQKEFSNNDSLDVLRELFEM